MTSFSGWLEQIGLAHHGPVLTENGIDFDVVPSLTEDDLRSVGLNLGDRRRLLQATARLGEQAGAPHTDPAGAAQQRADEFWSIVAMLLFSEVTKLAMWS